MPCAKAPKSRPVPLVRRLSVAFPSEKFGVLSGDLDLLDYGRGEPCTSANAYLKRSDGTLFYEGGVSLLNGGVIIESLKKNGRPGKPNRDAAVYLATEFFMEKRRHDATGHKPLRKQAYSDVHKLWNEKRYPAADSLQDKPSALNSKGKKEVDKAEPFGRMFYTTQDGLDGAVVHMHKGSRLAEWPGNEISIHGPCWVWRHGDENAEFYPAEEEAIRLSLKNGAAVQSIFNQLGHRAADSVNAVSTVGT